MPAGLTFTMAQDSDEPIIRVDIYHWRPKN